MKPIPRAKLEIVMEYEISGFRFMWHMKTLR